MQFLNVTYAVLERGISNPSQFQIISPKQLLSNSFNSKNYCRLLNYKKNLTANYKRISDVGDSKLTEQLKR